MDEGYKRRKKLFEKYSANLHEYLTALSVGRTESQQPVDLTGKVYFCPLCFEAFGAEDLVEVKGKNYLTLEHNPPKSMGGKGKGDILTCKQCNNKNGEKTDEVVRELLTKESFLFSPVGSLSARFRSGPATIQGQVRKLGDIKVLRPDRKSNPHLYNQIIQGINNGQPPKLDFTLTIPQWNEYSLGVLKIAYLKAFEYFGYHFADFGNGRDMHKVLRKEMEYPVPNNGIFDVPVSDHYVGVHVVKEPVELMALIITLKFSFEYDNNKVNKNVPVVLPHPFPGGWESLSNYKKYFGKQVNMKTERFSIRQVPILKIRDYYEMYR